MVSDQMKQEYYRALLDKNPDYEGVFFVGVKTTGVFCRPTCPARKPKFENCEFYETAKEALLASFRPCERCRPLSPPHEVSKLVQMLVEAVEAHPEKRWKEQDFKTLCVDMSTARRQFKKRFGMTFVQYARARRMGIAMKQIRSGSSVIDAQLSTGYESSSGFRDAFSRILGKAPTLLKEEAILKAAWIDTKLGPMVAVADDEALYLLEFVDRRGLEREIERLRAHYAVIPGRTAPIEEIERELAQYFEGRLEDFKTPVQLLGSDFQRSVWEELRKIPIGETRSYLELAKALKRPSACRAVARANGANVLALIIPCHRVIQSDGELGGYGGGIARKKWLLEHEKRFSEMH
jgi:AraC family transcriptional regulator, regulatory protein of adaptative response / methylated-DNA-[protein]-cysteine methyltransferase